MNSPDSLGYIDFTCSSEFEPFIQNKKKCSKFKMNSLDSLGYMEFTYSSESKPFILNS